MVARGEPGYFPKIREALAKDPFWPGFPNKKFGLIGKTSPERGAQNPISIIN